MNLGENIYRLRTGKNMSQGDLADALDVSRQSVSKWENGSATPELEKLIKMSQLFGVTLDQLAGLEQEPQSAQSTATEPQIIYIEKPTLPIISKHTLIGTALLVGAFFYALLLNSNVFGLTESIIMAAPVAVCGVLYLFVKYPQLFCGWVGAATYWLYLFILFHNYWEHQYTLLFFGVVLVIAMIVWTVKANNKGLVHIPGWLWLLGGLILAGAFILLWINVVPPIGVSVTEYATSAVKE